MPFSNRHTPLLTFFAGLNTLSARIFTDFGLRILEGKVLHKGAWIATLLGTLLEVQDYKKCQIFRTRYLVLGS